MIITVGDGYKQPVLPTREQIEHRLATVRIDGRGIIGSPVDTVAEICMAMNLCIRYEQGNGPKTTQKTPASLAVGNDRPRKAPSRRKNDDRGNIDQEAREIEARTVVFRIEDVHPGTIVLWESGGVVKNYTLVLKDK